jgi:hypothetical protein
VFSWGYFNGLRSAPKTGTVDKYVRAQQATFWEIENPPTDWGDKWGMGVAV